MVKREGSLDVRQSLPRLPEGPWPDSGASRWLCGTNQGALSRLERGP